MSGPGQTPQSVEQNRAFFQGNREYSERIGSLDTYRNIRAAIDREVRGTPHLLDVGNGGVFDYDTTLAERITAVDLFLDDVPSDAFPPNCTPLSGDALDLDLPDGSVDSVLFALVLHHLVGRRPEDLVANVGRAVAEAARVVRPGGRLIVVESCVAPWFHRVERVLFRPLALAARTPLMTHPATLQLPLRTLARLVAGSFQVDRVDRVPVGRWIVQLGLRWPTALTPARPVLITGRRPEEGP